MFWLPLAGLAAGAVKYGTDQEKANRDRKLAAATAKYSPWTGMNPQAVNEPSLIGNLVQGGTAGLMMGQQFEGGGASPTAMKTTGEIAPPNASSGWLDMQKYSPKYYNDYSQAAPTLYS